MSEKEIFEYLNEIGCCNLCNLRHLGCTNKKYYPNFELFLKEKNLCDKVEDEEIISNSKKLKQNVCIVCLGLLQNDFINNLLEFIDKNAEIDKYDCTSFACAISLPISQLIRAYSINLHLKEKFPEYYEKDNNEIPMKEVWKWVLGPKINERLNKVLDNGSNCDFLITINLQYVDEEKELNSLLKVSPETFKARNKNFRKFHGETFTRKSIETFLETVDKNIFKEHIVCPPQVPNVSLNCSSIFCTHNSIYLAGRYTKYSRELSQTPWIISGKRMVETSVQEIICAPLFSLYNFHLDNMKFASSGREDCDVRCLGTGRPFVLEIMNPKKTKFTYDEFRELESEINKSKLIQVSALQLVPKEDLIIIKQGEESKTKVYQALCISDQPLTQDILDTLTEMKDVVLQQKTPIRVLHRRPLAVRQRTIHNVKAQLVPGNSKMFILDVETQAGTYVKEFVHGDFGRTKPSLSSILGIDVDIIALDVMAVKLNWPKTIEV